MVSLVTGGCSGLGGSFTRYLATKCDLVYALYNSSVDEALAIESEFDNVRAIKCDIRDEKEVESTFFNIDNIDILINNAGIAKDNSYIEKTKREFMSVLETNVVGTFLVTKYALSKMNENGVIINISSNNSLDAYTPLSMDYDVSKAGVNMLTKDFSEVLVSQNKNVKIVSVCPGWINTEAVNSMNPDYLSEELKRTKQSELLDKDELVKFIIDNINNYKNGSIVEIKEVN